uniref:Potassium channel toxin alpha-KTx Tx308 n=1 Tax=Buthus israelis TaxID=2899555 RepID=KA23K_BUTIS|nr:RecName: Full=Potassium channel toxin alpha-KTx Tx308; Flags: Precursor [Buthus occitanus israelis]ACJ23139.1 putative potassium channel blocker Tx308 [Buthus occitanus israelis]
MQKLFIVLLLFCILRLDAEVDGRTMSHCNQSECQEKCKKKNKNGRCITEFEMNYVYNRCRCN